MDSILVVSADDQTRNQLTEWLVGPDRRVAGVPHVGVATIGDGQAGLVADVVFIDLDGQEASATSGVEQIRRTWAGVQVVAFAWNPTPETLGRLAGAGVYLTMVKPLDRLEVQDVATSALRRGAAVTDETRRLHRRRRLAPWSGP